MMRSVLLFALFALLATTAAAQQRPIFDPDDGVDPRSIDGPLFISRLVAGGRTGIVDDYRPLHQNAGFLLFTNSFYWKHYQFDYKHSEVGGHEGTVEVCPCNGHPLYFPTPPSRDSTPAPPPPGSKDTLQFGGYYPVHWGSAGPPVMLRLRLSWSRQLIDTDLTNKSTGVTSRISGREQSFGLDADTFFPILGHDIWGSLLFARTVSTGTIDNRSQTEFAYTSRFPGRAVGPLLVRAMLTVGGVTNRGASGLNIVNPAFEAFWHHGKSDVNVHLIWSPLTAKDGTHGWETHHQIALYVDRALYVHLFRPHAR